VVPFFSPMALSQPAIQKTLARQGDRVSNGDHPYRRSASHFLEEKYQQQQRDREAESREQANRKLNGEGSQFRVASYCGFRTGTSSVNQRMPNAHGGERETQDHNGNGGNEHLQKAAGTLACNCGKAEREKRRKEKKREREALKEEKQKAKIWSLEVKKLKKQLEMEKKKRKKHEKGKNGTPFGEKVQVSDKEDQQELCPSFRWSVAWPFGRSSKPSQPRPLTALECSDVLDTNSSVDEKEHKVSNDAYLPGGKVPQEGISSCEPFHDAKGEQAEWHCLETGRDHQENLIGLNQLLSMLENGNTAHNGEQKMKIQLFGTPLELLMEDQRREEKVRIRDDY